MNALTFVETKRAYSNIIAKYKMIIPWENMNLKAQNSLISCFGRAKWWSKE